MAERSRGIATRHRGVWDDKYFCQMFTPCMDHQSLKHILADKSVAAAAAIFHVTPRTVYRWCKKTGVCRRTYRCPDPQRLHRLEAHGMLQKQIAAAFGVCRCTIRLWCKRFGIIHHTTGQFLKGSNRNTSASHEMPIGIGVAFGG
jgi:Helix-turn-helix domain